MTSKLTGDSNLWLSVVLNVKDITYVCKKAQGNRLDMKTELILLMHTRNTSQLQRQTFSQTKRLGKKYTYQMNLREKRV